MKTHQQIEFKIAVHESKINEIIRDTTEWTDLQPELLRNYLIGRKALRWVLSPDDFIIEDELDKKSKYKIKRYERR